MTIANPAERELITAVIIEDEANAVALLTENLKAYCPHVKILGSADDFERGIELIDTVKPMLIFMDIRLGHGIESFDILRNIKSYDYKLIFVTAYREYAQKAFDFAALHYLSKPINPLLLIEAVDRFVYPTRDENSPETFQILEDAIKNKATRIKLVGRDGFDIVELETIYYCQSDGAYVRFFLNDGREILVCSSLGRYEVILSEYGFLRVHNRYVVNLRHVTRYSYTDGGQVELVGKIKIPVSRPHREKLFNGLNLITT